MYVINGKCNDTITDQEVLVFKGKDHIIEEMEGLQFKVGPKSFYQTNSEQAYNLYKVAREFAGLTGNEMVYDLYTGKFRLSPSKEGYRHRIRTGGYRGRKSEFRLEPYREHAFLCR